MSLTNAQYSEAIEFNEKFARRNGFADGLQDSPNPSTRAFVDWTINLQRKLGETVDGKFGSDTFEAYQKMKGIHVEPGELVPRDTSPGVIAYGRSIGQPQGVNIKRWFDPGDVPYFLGWNSSREGEPIRYLVVHEPVGSLKGTWNSFEKVRTGSSGKKYSHSVHFTIGLDGQIYQHGPLEKWEVNLPGMNKSGISIEPINRVNGKFRNGRYEAPAPYEGLILPAPWISDGDDEGYTVPPKAQLRAFVKLSNFLLGLQDGDIALADTILGYDRARNRFLIDRIDNWRDVADGAIRAGVPSSMVAHKWVGSHSDGVFYMLVFTLYREKGFSIEDAQAWAMQALTGADDDWIALPQPRGPRQLGSVRPSVGKAKGSYSASGTREYTVESEQAESVTEPKTAQSEGGAFWTFIKVAGAALTIRELLKAIRKR